MHQSCTSGIWTEGHPIISLRINTCCMIMSPDTTANPVFVRVATHNWTRRAGVGTIKVETVVNGKSFFKAIKNVWHVPEFAHSLLSVNMLKAQGCWGIVGRKGSQSTMDDFYFDERNQLWLVAKKRGGEPLPGSPGLSNVVDSNWKKFHRCRFDPDRLHLLTQRERVPRYGDRCPSVRGKKLLSLPQRERGPATRREKWGTRCRSVTWQYVTRHYRETRYTSVRGGSVDPA
jgi:hypothetical protein